MLKVVKEAAVGAATTSRFPQCGSQASEPDAMISALRSHRSVFVPAIPNKHDREETRAMSSVPESAMVIRILTDTIKEEQKKFLEQELRLHELDHRFKNMFSILAGLIRHQSHSIVDPNARKALGVAGARVEALGFVHQICSHEHSGNLTEVITSVCTNLVTADPRFELELEVARVSVPVQTATIVALIANELVTNAMKHSINDRAAGRIHVSLQPVDASTLIFSVSDDGEPLTGDNPTHVKGTGLNLISRLVRQLAGEFRVESAPKRYSVVFPAQFAVHG